MMELFSLGADRGAYTEDDVREMARALTGWTAEWTASSGLHNFRFDPARHDNGRQDRVRADRQLELRRRGAPLRRTTRCTPRSSSPSCGATSSPPARRSHARRRCRASTLLSGYSIRAVVEAILQHPDFHEGPELVTPPVVYNAGLLRAIGRPIDTTAWAWLSAAAGQQLFYPPNVSGWDFSRWLDTSTAKARWEIASYVTAKTLPQPVAGRRRTRIQRNARTPPRRFASALAYWGNPPLSARIAAVHRHLRRNVPDGRVTADWEQSPYRAIRQNALRMLIATSPDMQVS